VYCFAVAGDGQRAAAGWLSWILPRFEERIDPEFYRYSGKVRVLVAPLLQAVNWVVMLRADQIGIDMSFWVRHQTVNSIALGIDVLLSLVLWKASIGLATQRRLTVACATIETSSAIALCWVLGPVTSYTPTYVVALIFLYRGWFQFRVGAGVFLASVAGLWGIVVAQLAGWLPALPAASGDFRVMATVYDDRDLVAALMLGLTAALAFVFVLTNFMVARVRHREEAIRALRKQLASAAPERIGQHTGRILRDTYRVGGLLGRGGMGEVYEGIHVRTKRPIAIKLLREHLLDDERASVRFQREAEIAGRLGSQHIVEVIDVDRDQGRPFLAMELLEGEDLSKRLLRAGPMGLVEVARLVEQLGDALARAHEAGVVHRDLKPSNIFVSGEGEAALFKILDFGVSKLQDTATVLTGEFLVGTPAFMAPEQISAPTGDVDHRVDVYAFGAVVYTALAGQSPFVASNVPALLNSVMSEEPIALCELRPELPVAVASVIRIAMAKRLDERYEDVTSFARDFAAAIAGGECVEIAARAERVTPGIRLVERPGTGREASGSDDTETRPEDFSRP